MAQHHAPLLKGSGRGKADIFTWEGCVPLTNRPRRAAPGFSVLCPLFIPLSTPDGVHRQRSSERSKVLAMSEESEKSKVSAILVGLWYRFQTHAAEVVRHGRPVTPQSLQGGWLGEPHCRGQHPGLPVTWGSCLELGTGGFCLRVVSHRHRLQHHSCPSLRVHPPSPIGCRIFFSTRGLAEGCSKVTKPSE
jgi:hypothetical protein